MKGLDRSLLREGFTFPGGFKAINTDGLPEKAVQFGEGNFLRGFVDWMINRMNEKSLFNGRVAVVQPIVQGMADVLNKQDGLYTLILRGRLQEETVQSRELMTCISRGINPYTDYPAYLALAGNPELRVIISNTTEAGIAYSPEDLMEDTPPSSFPAKLAALLFRRFEYFKGDASKGFIILPCELIDRNGDNLKKIVLRYADEWGLGKEFKTWVEGCNHFLNTLVDRIVTGFPKDEAEKLAGELGYEDKLLDTGEIFHLWVIEGEKKLAAELPFAEAGLNVIWTEDLTPYRNRKVRILNGAHTMTIPAAYLFGLDTVKECMDDELVRTYMNKGIFEEIIPTLDMPEGELIEFAEAVAERFANPFIRHYLLSISLNSVSKFKTRVLPSILEYVKRKGTPPKILTFSLAALLAFYKGVELRGRCLIGRRPGNEYEINDDLPILEMFRSLWQKFDGTKNGAGILAAKVLQRTDLWGMDLNDIEGFTPLVTVYLYGILTEGVGSVMKALTAASRG